LGLFRAEASHRRFIDAIDDEGGVDGGVDGLWWRRVGGFIEMLMNFAGRFNGNGAYSCKSPQIEARFG
jgi:hypothetical protein